MKELVKVIAMALVDHPDQVVVTEEETEKAIVVELRVAPEDMGKVIGKQGRIAKSIRTVVKAASTKDDKKVVVEADKKRFDFVIKTPGMIYGIETNFYGSGGSKLNETARSYKTLAWETEDIDGFTFVWFTDGKGWTSARNNLEETFDVMQHIYNIKDLENGVIREVFK